MLKRSGEADVQEFPWGRIEWLVSGSLGNSASMTVGRVTIRAGQQNAEHRHPNCDEVLYLVEGALQHAVNGQEHPMAPGDAISIPAGTWHNARARGKQDAIMLVAYSSPDRQTEMRA